MNRTFKVGDKIWHGSRYWVSLGDRGFVGWNTRFVAYRIIKLTPARIVCESLIDGPKPITLNRKIMEARGKQYHTRFHEYFYAEKPERDPEQKHSATSNAMTILSLQIPYSQDDVRRAYKRLAKTMHPDGGGTSAGFVELKRAHDEALRGAI